MKIVVTGALGHIGSYLIRYLAEKELAQDIILIDDLSTQRYTSLFNLKASATYRFIDGNLLKLGLHEVFKGVDTVIHLAAVTDAASLRVICFDSLQSGEIPTRSLLNANREHVC